MKTKILFPVIISGIITAIVTIILSGCHGCCLHSTIIELLLLVLTPIFFCIWTAKTRTTGKAWLRTVLSFFIVIVIQLSYLAWLHSPLFPDFLLSPYSKKQQMKFEEFRKRMIRIENSNATDKTESEKTQL